MLPATVLARSGRVRRLPFKQTSLDLLSGALFGLETAPRQPKKMLEDSQGRPKTAQKAPKMVSGVPEEASRQSNGTSRWPHEGPRGRQNVLRGLQYNAQKALEMYTSLVFFRFGTDFKHIRPCGLLKAQHGQVPKRVPRQPKRAPRGPQDGPGGPQDCPRGSQDGPRGHQDGHRDPQEGPKRGPRGGKQAGLESFALQDCL